MQVLDLVQGSPEWVAVRARYHGASEAAAMMNADPKKSRQELVRIKAIGTEQEFSDWVQENLLDKGHEIEARARVIVRKRLGKGLYPLTAVADTGKCLASFDGVTADRKVGFECKSWNQELIAQIRSGEIGARWFWQLEQQLWVNEQMEKIIFVCTDGTEDNFESIEYTRVPGRAEQLVAGWALLDKDVEAYVHVEPVIKLVADAVPALPALFLNFRGDVSVESNLGPFVEAVKARIAEINLNPKTDQEFSNAEAIVSDLNDRRARARVALDNFLNANGDVSAVISSAEEIIDMMGKTANSLAKTIKNKKDTRKADLIEESKSAFAAHITQLNRSLGKPYMPEFNIEWLGLLKGMRSFDAMADKLKGQLATGKLAANDRAEKIRANMATAAPMVEKYPAMFTDLGRLVLMDHDPMVATMKQRISDHEEAERQKREAADVKVKKDKAEQDRRMALSEIDGIRQQVAIAVTGRQGVRKGGTIECIRETLTETQAWVIDDHFGDLRDQAQQAKDSAISQIQALLTGAEAAAKVTTQAPAVAAGAMAEINESLGAFAPVAGSAIVDHAEPAVFQRPAVAKVVALATALRDAVLSDDDKKEQVIQRIVVKLRALPLADVEQYELAIVEDSFAG